MLTKTFVINLARNPERKAAMECLLAASGLDVEFLTAVDGAALDRAGLSGSDASTQLSNGELGCYLSHVKAWQRVVQDNLSFALILEDDVDAREHLASVCGELERLPIEFDMIRLSSIMPVAGTEVVKLSKEHSLILPHKNPSGAHGYLISRRGAARLLDRFRVPRLPIDKMLDAYWNLDLDILLLDPPAVLITNAFPSSIDASGARWRRPPRGNWLRRSIVLLRQRMAIRLMRHRLLRQLRRGKPAAPALGSG